MSVLVEPINGRPHRKQLSDQLDRLDGIIDCLADALPEAVRDAVRDGTEAALQHLIRETLANPAVLDQLRRALDRDARPAPSRKAAFLARCQAGLAAVKDRAARAIVAVGSLAAKTVAPVKTAVVRTVAKARSVIALGRLAWHLKRAAIIGVALGGIVAAVSLVSHPVATVLSGVGAAATAITVQMALHCRKALRPWMT